MKIVDTIGDRLEGYAARFNRRVILGNSAGKPSRETIIAPGVFARSLLEGDCELCYAEHGGRVAASTQNGTLFLEERADGLFFVAWPENCLAGWLLVRDVAAGRLREVSFSAHPATFGQVGGSRVVSQYDLVDITICDRGAQQNCYVKLTTKAELVAERAAKVAKAAAESAAAPRATWLPARPYVVCESSRPYRFAV